MNSKIISFAFLVLCVQLASGMKKISELDAMIDAQWTKDINAELCAEGTHSDEVSARFYACYEDVVGGQQYKDCQIKVYGGYMNTKAAVEDVCTSGKFVKYATCVIGKFALNFVNPLEAIHDLAVCQGGILGVPRPESYEF